MIRKTSKVLLGAMLGAGIAGSAQAEVRMGWTAWSDAEFITKLAAQILEDRMDEEVDLIQTDIAPQYQGLANGDLDVMLMSWQPGTHADYLEQFGTDIISLGILYGYAKLGWVVPDYIPESELSSIADLQDDSVRERLDGTIVGIDPGAGLTRLSKQAVQDYGLDDYQLQISSGAGMTAALDRAVEREEWIVVTGWSPHWKFGAYDLRYLEDPEGTLGGYERIHAMARQGFAEDNHDAALFLSRMFLPIDMLEQYMFEAQETSYEDAVDNFISENEALVEYWVSGEM